MPHHNRVVVDWDDDRTVILTVTVRPRNGEVTGEEWRLEQEIAAVIWAAYHCDQLSPRGDE